MAKSTTACGRATRGRRVIAPLVLAGCALFTACRPSGSTGSTGDAAAGDSTGASGAATGNNANAAGVASNTGAPVRIVGRANTADANGPRLSWPGTQIVAGFRGTQLTVNLAEVDSTTYDSSGTVSENAFDVYVDSMPYTTMTMTHGVTSYLVAQNLADSNHIVRMTKRTESDMGTVQFLGVSPGPGGASVNTPAPSPRRIEFVGDSATAGYGADANVTLATMCPFTPATERADASYAVQTGIMLGADVHDTSYSGKGLYQNRDAAGDPVHTLPNLWTFTLGDTSILNVPWDPSQWVPQAVVAVVSGNDFYASTPSRSAFVTTVTSFIGVLRAAYPSAAVFIMVSPMLRSAGSDGTANAGPRATGMAYAQATVAQANTVDPNVFYLDTPEDLGPNFGCDQHLTTVTHRKYAAHIANAIGAKLGWAVNTAATSF